MPFSCLCVPVCACVLMCACVCLCVPVCACVCLWADSQPVVRLGRGLLWLLTCAILDLFPGHCGGQGRQQSDAAGASLILSHTHTHTLSLFLSLSRALALSLSPPDCPRHDGCLCLSLCLSLSARVSACLLTHAHSMLIPLCGWVAFAVAVCGGLVCRRARVGPWHGPASRDHFARVSARRLCSVHQCTAAAV
jgi:hypothetical protein